MGLYERKIRIFDYPKFAEPFRNRIRESAESLAAEGGIEIEFIRKRNFRKEDRVKDIIAKRGADGIELSKQPGLKFGLRLANGRRRRRGQPVSLPDPGQTLPHQIAIGSAKVSLGFIAFAITTHQQRIVFLDEREEHPPGGGHQEEQAAREIRSAVFARSLCERVETRFLIGNQGHHRIREDPHRDARICQSPHRRQAQIGAGSAGFQRAGQRNVERGDGHVDRQVIVLRHLAQQRDIALNQIGFCRDRQR